MVGKFIRGGRAIFSFAMKPWTGFVGFMKDNEFGRLIAPLFRIFVPFLVAGFVSGMGIVPARYQDLLFFWTWGGSWLFISWSFRGNTVALFPVFVVVCSVPVFFWHVLVATLHRSGISEVFFNDSVLGFLYFPVWVASGMVGKGVSWVSVAYFFLCWLFFVKIPDWFYLDLSDAVVFRWGKSFPLWMISLLGTCLVVFCNLFSPKGGVFLLVECVLSYISVFFVGKYVVSGVSFVSEVGASLRRFFKTPSFLSKNIGKDGAKKDTVKSSEPVNEVPAVVVPENAGAGDGSVVGGPAESVEDIPVPPPPADTGVGDGVVEAEAVAGWDSPVVSVPTGVGTDGNASEDPDDVYGDLPPADIDPNVSSFVSGRSEGVSEEDSPSDLPVKSDGGFGFSGISPVRGDGEGEEMSYVSDDVRTEVENAVDRLRLCVQKSDPQGVSFFRRLWAYKQRLRASSEPEESRSADEFMRLGSEVKAFRMCLDAMSADGTSVPDEEVMRDLEAEDVSVFSVPLSAPEELDDVMLFSGADVVDSLADEWEASQSGGGLDSFFWRHPEAAAERNSGEEGGNESLGEDEVGSSPDDSVSDRSERGVSEDSEGISVHEVDRILEGDEFAETAFGIQAPESYSQGLFGGEDQGESGEENGVSLSLFSGNEGEGVGDEVPVVETGVIDLDERSGSEVFPDFVGDSFDLSCSMSDALRSIVIADRDSVYKIFRETRDELSRVEVPEIHSFLVRALSKGGQDSESSFAVCVRMRRWLGECVPGLFDYAGKDVYSFVAGVLKFGGAESSDSSGEGLALVDFDRLVRLFAFVVCSGWRETFMASVVELDLQRARGDFPGTLFFALAEDISLSVSAMEPGGTDGEGFGPLLRRVLSWGRRALDKRDLEKSDEKGGPSEGWQMMSQRLSDQGRVAFDSLIVLSSVVDGVQQAVTNQCYLSHSSDGQDRFGMIRHDSSVMALYFWDVFVEACGGIPAVGGDSLHDRMTPVEIARNLAGSDIVSLVSEAARIRSGSLSADEEVMTSRDQLLMRQKELSAAGGLISELKAKLSPTPEEKIKALWDGMLVGPVDVILKRLEVERVEGSGIDARYRLPETLKELNLQGGIRGLSLEYGLGDSRDETFLFPLDGMGFVWDADGGEIFPEGRPWMKFDAFSFVSSFKKKLSEQGVTDVKILFWNGSFVSRLEKNVLAREHNGDVVSGPGVSWFTGSFLYPDDLVGENTAKTYLMGHSGIRALGMLQL